MLLCFTACAAEAPVDAPATTESTAPAKTMSNEKFTIDGFFSDTSYVDSDGKPLKMVYVFMTVKAGESNMDVDCKYTDLKIGENTYSSDFYKGACEYMPSFYYSSFVEEVFVGTELKLAMTFKVPEGDLVPGKDVTLSDTSMPFDGILFSTDDLVSCGSAQEIGEQIDAEACAQVVHNQQPADDATVQTVRNALNGYYFEFYVTLGTSVTKYELEFFSPNEFELRTPILNNSGTYEVLNGYVSLHYHTSDTPLLIAYEFIDGEINLYCSDAFNIYE